MKNRSQPFPCAIAAKVVGITLRHGGGLQEPDRVYVRCDERDCQYVDLNESPCPLRPDMFADGSDDRVTAYLVDNAGSRVCYACLTDQLEITHDQVRRASWRLKNEAGFSIRPSRCSVCRHRRVTIGVAAGAASPWATRRAGRERPLERGTLTPSTVPTSNDVARPAEPSVGGLEQFLRDHRGFSFCAHCLGRELKARPAVMRDAMWTLEREAAFQIRTAQCVSCLLTKRVIRYEEPGSETSLQCRVIDFLVQSAGQMFCPTCVAFAVDVALFEARRVLSYLEPLDEFLRKEAPCAACGRWHAVIGVRTSHAETTERLDESGAIFDGRFTYRGVRIDVLSFRVPEGWRPFVLIKSASGTAVPDTPLLLDVVATKAEADSLAVDHARLWIDKHVP